jgi:NAD(P)H-hydrate epimerase
LRAPFDECIDKIIKSNIPIVSVDCPTGWKVEVESQSPTKLQPEMLISLTAPKECAKYFNGPHHILGGRFIPKYLPLKFQKLIFVGNLYKENELFIELSK